VIGYGSRRDSGSIVIIGGRVLSQGKPSLPAAALVLAKLLLEGLHHEYSLAATPPGA